MKVILSIIALVVLLYFPFYADKQGCYGAWEHSGMNVSWGAFKGCTIQREDGTWIPADAYRENTK
jgi:hypothetical protein